MLNKFSCNQALYARLLFTSLRVLFHKIFIKRSNSMALINKLTLPLFPKFQHLTNVILM